VILREDILIKPLDTWLAQEFGPRQREHTVARIVDQARSGMPVAAPLAPSGPSVADCDVKLDRYRAALDAGADPAVVAQWIAETQIERQRAQTRQQAEAAKPSAVDLHQLTADDVLAMIEELGDMAVVLGEADPEHKLQVYRNLGLRLTYLPERQTVRADVNLAAHRWDSGRVRGSTQTNTPLPPILEIDVIQV
jgi:hypothetical protein